MFLTEPKGLADAKILEERRAMLLTEPRVQPLREWCSDLAERRGVVVPEFDPAEAGIEARVLIFHEVPAGPMIDRGKASERPVSGFVSVDNDDQSAANMWSLREESGLKGARERVSAFNGLRVEVGGPKSLTLLAQKHSCFGQGCCDRLV